MEKIGNQKMAWQKDELAAMHHEEHVAAFVAKGRLHTPLSHRWLLGFLVIFLLLLFIPGIEQARKEWRSPEGVQILHLFRDMTVTPNERAAALRNRLDAVANTLQQGSWNDSGSVAWEGISQALLECSQTVRIVNRHVEMDSLDPEYTTWARAAQFAQAMGENPIPDSIAALQTLLQSIRNSNAMQAGIWPSILRVSKAMVRYTLLSREYLRAWEKETEDASTFAQTMRPLLQQSRYQIFGDLGIKGVNGEQNWVFYRPGLEYAVRPWVTDVRSRIVDPNDKPLTDDPIQAVVEFQKQLQERDIELLVVPVPNKETVYPDYLNSAFNPEQSGKVGQGHAVLDSLRAKGVHVVDLYSAFAEERKKDKGLQDALYLKDDTHWQLRGLRVASRTVAQEIRSMAWFLSEPMNSVSYESRACTVARDGDILAMSKLPASWFPAESVPCEQVYTIERDSIGAIVDSTLYKDDFRKSRILILGDSFSRIYQTDAPNSAGWIAHLAMDLGEPLASMVSDGGSSTLVREKLARKSGVLRGKKLVVWEFVERDYRFGDGGWKKVHLNP